MVPVDELGGRDGELAHQVVARGRPDLGDHRQDHAVRLAHPLDEHAVVVGAGLRRDLVHPRHLLGGRAAREQDAELVGDPAHLLVELGVLDGELAPDLPDLLAARLLFGLLAGGCFPQAGQPDLDEEIPVGGPERAELGLRPATGARRAGRP
ncbi:hypothetical protein BJF78_29095 [Pseudonocardia sp. CNS-139]|nr:hypothetical protein BJF78_29095 [Pseudonocardia sp. CNS-139]